MKPRRFKRVVKWKEGSMWNRFHFCLGVGFVYPVLLLNLWFPLLDNIVSKIIWSFLLLIILRFASIKDKYMDFGKREVTYEEIK